MLTKLHFITIFCLTCFFLGGGITPAVAQEQGIPEQEVPETTSRSFADLGYEDLRLKGLYGISSLWIPFQSDWPIADDVQFELTYTGSPLLNSDAAIVTILANNQEVTSFRPVGDGRPHTITFSVPPGQQLPDGINLTFAGHLRLTDDPCEDSFNVGQWLTVHNSSRVSAKLLPTSPTPEITDLPQAIVVQGSQNPPPIIFVLPENADDLTLTTAAQVAARLGDGLTADHLPIRVAAANSLTDADKRNANLVLIGLPGNQPLIQELSSLMPVPPAAAGFVSQDGVLIPPGDGVIQIFSSPWQPRHHILLVSGNDAAGLAKAGQAFAHQPTFASLTGSFHFVRDLVNRPEPAVPPPWTTAQTTFTQLGEVDREVVGLGLTDSSYFFQYPPGVMLADNAKLVLHLAFSPALRAQGSYAEVYVNDIYVGAVEAARAGGGAWVSLDLPAQALNELIPNGRARELNVNLAIANLLPANNCEQVNAESSWTKIYADSYFQFDYLPVELPDLYHFPYPFVTPENHTPVRLVLPQTPTVEELQTALSISALMGSQGTTDLAVDVVRSTAVDPEALAGHHLVLIGTPFDNPALQEVLTGQQTSMPVEVYQILGAPNAGFFHMLTSPWDEEMSVLGIYGEMETGFKIAADTLYEQGRLAHESGSIALARTGEPPVIIYREAGLSDPQFVQPDIIMSESGQQPNVVTDPTATAVSANESTAPVSEMEAGSGSRLTNTEQLILIITAFLIILVTVAALLRIAWRIRA